MKPDRRRAMLGVMTVTGAAAAGAQVRHLRRIAADPMAPALELEPGHPMPVRSADGTVLHAEVFGPDGAPTIVLAHGWLESIRLWVHQIRDLSRDFRIVAYDQRAHGRSSRAATDDYSVARLGEDLDAVLHACVPAGERPIVAGHSMGAMALAAWAERADVEARIRAAALLNTGVGNLIAEQGIIRLPLGPALTETIGRKLFLGNGARLPRFTSPIHHAILRYVAFGPEAGAASVAFMLGMVNETRDADRAACGLAIADIELHHALARLTVPTLVIAGTLDRLTPLSHARRMEAELPQPSEIIVLEQTGHMGPLERPAEYSAALRALAARAGAESRLAHAA